MGPFSFVGLGDSCARYHRVGGILLRILTPFRSEGMGVSYTNSGSSGVISVTDYQ